VVVGEVLHRDVEEAGFEPATNEGLAGPEVGGEIAVTGHGSRLQF